MSNTRKAIFIVLVEVPIMEVFKEYITKVYRPSEDQAPPINPDTVNVGSNKTSEKIREATVAPLEFKMRIRAVVDAPVLSSKSVNKVKHGFGCQSSILGNNRESTDIFNVGDNFPFTLAANCAAGLIAGKFVYTIYACEP